MQNRMEETAFNINCSIEQHIAPKTPYTSYLQILNV